VGSLRVGGDSQTFPQAIVLKIRDGFAGIHEEPQHYHKHRGVGNPIFYPIYCFQQHPSNPSRRGGRRYRLLLLPLVPRHVFYALPPPFASPPDSVPGRVPPAVHGNGLAPSVLTPAFPPPRWAVLNAHSVSQSPICQSFNALCSSMRHRLSFCVSWLLSAPRSLPAGSSAASATQAKKSMLTRLRLFVKARLRPKTFPNR